MPKAAEPANVKPSFEPRQAGSRASGPKHFALLSPTLMDTQPPVYGAPAVCPGQLFTNTTISPPPTTALSFLFLLHVGTWVGVSEG